LCDDPSVRRKVNDGAGADGEPAQKPVGLRELARHLGLSPTTISLVLNASPGAQSIPKATQDKVIAAARRFNYRPNLVAKSLRSKRSYAIGVMVPELSEGYSALVVSGIEDSLIENGYMYMATSHRAFERQIETLARMMWERCVEGLILVDTPPRIKQPLPIVTVSGHEEAEGITNLVLDHDAAAHLGIGHLRALGYRHIAVMKGQEFSSDTEVRWRAIEAAARAQGVPIDPRLVVQLEGNSPSPETGYHAAQQLMGRAASFTALFAFNDVSAFGAIRAFQERGLRVPESVSVVGFDDVLGAAFHIPALTTIRQPLREMGALAASTLLAQLRNAGLTPVPSVIAVQPTLIVRESTATPPAR
jgi:LacI family transcriptional regulator